VKRKQAVQNTFM